MKGGLPAVIAIVWVLAACGRESTDAGHGLGAAVRPEPVVVYAAHDDPTYWPVVFAGFTRETGIRVTVRHRDAQSIVNEVIENQGSPPADVLLTPDAYGVWKAAYEGALRPLRSDVIAIRVDPSLRDPDGYWVAVRTRTAVVVSAADFDTATGIDDLAALGDPAHAGQLCLTTSALSLNRVLIATLIERYGVRDSELTVRGWVRNLALPPFADEVSLRDAIRNGTCGLGILSADAASGLTVLGAATEGLNVIDIDGIGIARHAREPDAALELIEWLIETRLAGPPVAGDRQPVARVAWRIDDAIRLAERAGYR